MSKATEMRSELPNWESLQGRIDGDVALPGSPAYQALPPPFNARFRDVRPAAVVSCASSQDVAEATSFARRHGLELASRAGGHSFAAHSSTRGVLLDVTPMRSVRVAGGVATVGAGARLGEVYEAMQEHDLTIPGGACPSVGVAGLSLGGGLGILGRKDGVTSDHLIGAEVVLADGRILRCDDHHEADLFWALRGAGAGNFGVVTTLVFRALPAPPTTTNVHLAWPYAQAAAVIEAWLRWAPTAPDGLAAGLKITARPAPDPPGGRGRHPENPRRPRPRPPPRRGPLRRVPWVPGRRRPAGRGAGRPHGHGPHRNRHDVHDLAADPQILGRAGQPRRGVRQAVGPPAARSTVSLREVGVLRPPPPGRGGRRAAGGFRRRGDRRGVPRAGLHALGRRLQPPSARRHRLRPPRPALPAQARRGGGSRRPSGGPGRGPSGGPPGGGGGSPLGLRTGVPELCRSRPGALGTGLLRPELRPVGPGQGTVRPSE